MIYLILVFVWPLINYLQVNLEKINQYNDVFVILFILILIACVIYIVIKKLCKKSIDAFLLPIFMVVYLFFSYSQIVDMIGTHKIANFNLKASYVYLMFVFLLLWISYKISSRTDVKKVSKIFILIVFGSSIISLCIKSISQLNDKHNVIIEKILYEYTFKHKPNVYYILLDAYGRQDILREIMDYDNEPFLKNLEELGFVVSRKARSNYHFTVASLSATMNMSYHRYNVENIVPYKQMRFSLWGDNLVRKLFKANGYIIVNIPSHWHEMSCLGYEDFCINNKSYEIYESFLSITPLNVLISFLHFVKYANYFVKYVDFESVVNAFYLSPAKPKFIFAHFAQIHDTVFNEHGKFNNKKNPIFTGGPDNIKDRSYIYSIKAINLQLIKFIQDLKKKDSNAIIILQADHGVPFGETLISYGHEYCLKNQRNVCLTNKQFFNYRFGIFSAIYFPKYDHDHGHDLYFKMKEYFSGEFTLVNTFRYIFAYLSDSSPDLLANKSHFLYNYGESLDYKEINIEHLLD